ncbi:MAG: hypothetical protein ACO3YQ_08190, partial [Flavobacteriales bacterium]
MEKHPYPLRWIAVVGFAGTVCASALGQTAVPQMPYNPDFDNNGMIEVVDLLEFLPFYGVNFSVDGVLPGEFGGFDGRPDALNK